MLTRRGLRFRIFLFFAALALGAIAAVAAGLVLAARRIETTGTGSALALAGAVGGFGILGLTAWVWFLFDENVARPIVKLAGGLRARAHSDVTNGLDAGIARYLGDLAPAAAAVTGQLSDTRNALAEAVQRETLRLAREKRRLEALLSDVSVGVLLCSADHMVVFYNGQAADLLGQGLAPGLDRRVFDFLREAPVRHAYDRLASAGGADAVSDLLCATVAGARLLAGRMRLLDGGEGGAGYVLTLRDVTADLAAHAGRDKLLQAIFDRIRRPAANLQTVIGVRAEAGAAGGAGALDAALIEEVARLVAAINELGSAYDEARGDWWPLSMVRAADLADTLRARAEAAGIALTVEAEELSLRCDGFEVVSLLSGLAERVAAAGNNRDLALSVTAEGAGALIRLGWRGRPVTVGTLDQWLEAPLDTGIAGVTGRSVLAVHATECWPSRRDGGGAIDLPLRHARQIVRRPPPVARSVVYDFDLLFKPRAEALAATPLSDLTYVVFDTETTGLLPDEGDEIVQLAAVRLVNGRRVEGEVMDVLVNPGRAIPPRSTEVHGITDSMVADAPAIGTVGRQFHSFSAGAVLVAHNAPFDMEFLRRHEATIGLSFDNPILDTVLLSAVVFGQEAEHSLDALTRRLGIVIPDELRHTAIGDAEATADAFLKLLGMLGGMGIRTFGDLLAEVRRHGRLLRDLNA